MEKILKGIGLSEKEAKIYLALLDFGEALPRVIANRSGVKRSTAYFTLNELVKKGIASKVKIGGYDYYQPISPQSLLDQQSKLFKDLESIVPDLVARQGRFSVQPQITIHHGREGVIHVMEDSLTTDGEIYAWANIDEAATGYLKDYYPEYIKKKNKKKIWVRAIFTGGPEGKKFQERGLKELREVYAIPEEIFPFANEINIYDDRIFIISHADKLGIIIRNKNIAETQRSIFKLSFYAAKKIDKEGRKFYENHLKEGQRLDIGIK